MKKILISAALFLSGMSAFSQTQEIIPIVGTMGVENLIVEIVTPSAQAYTDGVPAGALAYRIFVDMEAGYKLIGFSGNDAATPVRSLEVSSTLPFYNPANTGATGADVNVGFWGIPGFSNLAYDSYASDGRVGAALVGIPYSLDTDGTVDGYTALTAATTPIIDVVLGLPHPFLTNNTTTSFIEINGGWGIGQVVGPTADNIVFVGQLTTAGQLSFSATVTVSDQYLNQRRANDVTYPVAPDNAPTANWINPVNGSVFNKGASVDLEVFASDDNAVASVEFFVNGVSVGTDNTSNGNTNPANATHVITWSAVGQTVTAYALVTDDAGQITQTSPVALTINDPNPTIVNLTSPVAGSYNLAQLTLTADATDADEPVQSVEFLVGGISAGIDSDGTNGWSVLYSPVAGSNINVVARATNSVGDVVPSSPVVVSFANAAPVITNLTPSVFNLSVGNDTSFSAIATDVDGSVSSVLFQVSGPQNASFTDNTATDGFSFTYSPSVPGAYSVTAIATDNSGTQSAGVSASFNGVFAAGSGYTIFPVVDYCNSSDIFCLPVVTTAAVSGVIGYDLELRYDNTRVTPTGVVVAGEELILDRDWTSYNYNIVGDTMIRISLFFNGTAPANTSFNGEGQVFCVEFARNFTFGNVDQAEFSIPVLSESYSGFVVDITSGITGTYSTIRETEFNGKIAFWADNQPLSIDLATEITPAGAATPVVNPIVNGSFVWDITNGTNINIVRDINSATSVMPVINGYDAFLTSKVSVEDATFRPNVYQIIAMDVNRDGRVAAGDITQISQRAVDQIDGFAADWVFIPSKTILNDNSFRISANYPATDGVGYSRLAVPTVVDNIALPVQDATGCPIIDDESYKAVLLGDADGSYAGYTSVASPLSVAVKSTKSNGDEIVFDLDNAKLEGNVIEIPIMVSSTETLNSIDFNVNFNSASMEFVSIVDFADIQETVNMVGSNLKMSSYSNGAINTEKAVLAVRFALDAQISSSDISFEVALLNGKSVDAKVVGVAQSPNATSISNLTDAVIYPNPTNNLVNVVFDGIADVSILNINGQVIDLQKDVNGSTTFDVSVLPSGNYTVLVGSNAYQVIVVE